MLKVEPTRCFQSSSRACSSGARASTSRSRLAYPDWCCHGSAASVLLRRVRLRPRSWTRCGRQCLGRRTVLRDDNAVATTGPRDETGSALILMPAAVLVLVILAAIAVDAAIMFLGERELAAATAAAAN